MSIKDTAIEMKAIEKRPNNRKRSVYDTYTKSVCTKENVNNIQN